MLPRLYLQTLQYAMYNPNTKEVVFETRYVTGSRYHFILTVDQFISLDETIGVINSSRHYGHYPLGQNVWLHYSEQGATLYRDIRNNGRINFNFENFTEYKSCVHKRLLSLIRSAANRKVTRRRGRYDHFASKANKRSLSNNLWSRHKSKSYERSDWRSKQTSPRSTAHANMSSEDEAHSLFPERNNPSYRRRSISPSSSTDLFRNITSPTSIQLDSPASDPSLESE